MQKRTELEYKYFHKSKNKVPSRKLNIYRQIGDDKILSINRYDYKHKTARNVSIQQFKNRKLIQRLDAPLMKWNTDLKKWSISEYELRTWNDSNIPGFLEINKDTLMDFHFNPFDLTKQLVNPEEINYS